MTVRCIIALSIIGLLSFVSYYSLVKVIEAEETSAAIINVSGRQRMLSQRIAHFATLLYYWGEGKSELDQYRKELPEIIALMEKSHSGLINGDPDLNLPGNPSPKIRKIHMEPPLFLDKQVRRYLKEARALLQTPDGEISSSDSNIRYINEAARGELLTSLDKVVKQYQIESETDINKLKNMERAVLGITLFTLVVVGVFIFRPMVKRILKETERRETLIADLNRANVELSDFSHIVSHDLKAPFRAIHNYSDFLKEDLEGKLEQEQQEYLDGLTRAVRQGEEFINDLLELSHLNKHELVFKSTNAGLFLQELVSSINPPSDVEIKIADEWPTIDVEQTLFRQIFLNLIGNAVKFNRSNPKLVELGWSPLNGSHYELFVRDNGIGIEKRFYEQIFRPFQRLHTKKEYDGTGIGLAIVAKAVNRLQGSVRIESKPDEGSVFFITVPRMRKEVVNGE